MTNLKPLVDKFRVITGAVRKHNRALREIGELLDELQKFLTEFGDPEVAFAGDNVVNARVLVATLMYKVRNSERNFRQVHNKDKELMPLVLDVYDRLENVRVDVYNPKKGRVSLGENLASLRSSVGALGDAVSGIAFE